MLRLSGVLSYVGEGGLHAVARAGYRACGISLAEDDVRETT